MKLNRKTVITSSIGFVLIVATAIIVPIVLHYKLDTFTEDPIIIWSDQDFLLYEFPGEGTEDNPYIIENYNINTTAEKGIHIRNTTKYFIIRYCYVEAESEGIYIDKIASGTGIIRNVTCINNQIGIRIERSDNLEIINCILEENKEHGIFVFSSNSTLIDNNIIQENHQGMKIEQSHQTKIQNNLIFKNSRLGIRFYRSVNCTVVYNRIILNFLGIALLDATKSSIITYNLIRDNILGGIWIFGAIVYDGEESSNNVIHHNSFIDNAVVSGAHQALDDGCNNTWFDIISSEGNYWSDYLGSGTYSIYGSAYSIDLYPLEVQPLIP